jgi:pimeloyl-ACP methyl ester carboxylesterase
MTQEAALVPLISLRQRSCVIGRLIESAPDSDLVVVGRHASLEDGLVSRIRRSFRERLQAITNIGLSQPVPEREPSRRRSVAPCDSGPRLGYLTAGDPEGRKVVFVHGTPGNATDWMAFLRGPPAGQHRLAIDRPGFGESGSGGSVVSLTEQARAIATLLESVGGPAVVVGSSYGGPVALRLAVDYPDRVAGLLLVGGAADPEREKAHTLQRLVAAPMIAALLPRALAHSNAELLALRGELEALAGDLERIRAPVTILHGLGDTLVPAENAAFLAERLKGAAWKRIVLVAQAGHFLHLLSPGLVEDALARVLTDVDRSTSTAANPVE